MNSGYQTTEICGQNAHTHFCHLFRVVGGSLNFGSMWILFPHLYITVFILLGRWVDKYGIQEISLLSVEVHLKSNWEEEKEGTFVAVIKSLALNLDWNLTTYQSKRRNRIFLGSRRAEEYRYGTQGVKPLLEHLDRWSVRELHNLCASETIVPPSSYSEVHISLYEVAWDSCWRPEGDKRFDSHNLVHASEMYCWVCIVCAVSFFGRKNRQTTRTWHTGKGRSMGCEMATRM